MQSYMGLSPVLALNEAIVYENVSEALTTSIQLSRQVQHRVASIRHDFLCVLFELTLHYWY